MIIGGLQKLSLLDYPGHLAAVIFLAGCNFRCRFCHNPMLVRPTEVGKLKYQKGHLIKTDDLFAFLKKRQGKLEGAVVSGGEPTINPDLPEFLAALKKIGFLIKLDTNGSHPAMLEKLMKKKLLDYLAMDLKAPFIKYEKITGVKANLAKIKKSIKIIKESGLPYEFRTTVAPGLIEKEDIILMGESIQGGEKWFLQGFRPAERLVDEKFKKTKPYSLPEMEEMRRAGEKYVRECLIRGEG